MGAEKLARKAALTWKRSPKALATQRRLSGSPGPTAEDSSRRASLSVSSRAPPETSLGPPVLSRPTCRWAFRHTSRLLPAPAGFRRCGREWELAGRARGAGISWRISFRVMCRAPKNSLDSLPLGPPRSALSPNRKTHPAPLPEAATRPGALRSEGLCAFAFESRRAVIAGCPMGLCRTDKASACGRHPAGEEL